MLLTSLTGMNQQEEFYPFIEGCLPKLKLRFAYFWINFQAKKRKFYKKYDYRMPIDIQKSTREEIEEHPVEEKLKWAQNLLRKLKKDIKPECRDEFIKAIKGEKSSECVISNPDQKGKMRRIDCLRQADKVWRLDLVMMILFHATPLESTDSERLSKIQNCEHRTLCVNPLHIGLVAKEFDIYMSNCLLHKETVQPNIIHPGILTNTDLNQYTKETYPTTQGSYTHDLCCGPISVKLNQRPHPYSKIPRTNCRGNDAETEAGMWLSDDSGLGTPTNAKTDGQEANSTVSAAVYTSSNKTNLSGNHQQQLLRYAPRSYENSGVGFVNAKIPEAKGTPASRYISKHADIYEKSFNSALDTKRWERPCDSIDFYDISGNQLEQSMTISYPQNGAPTKFNGNKHPSTTAHHYQNQLATINNPSAVYRQPMDFNSSCGSELSSANYACAPPPYSQQLPFDGTEDMKFNCPANFGSYYSSKLMPQESPPGPNYRDHVQPSMVF